MERIPPCQECPYKLGFLQTFKNPCPQCELEGYKMFEIFRSRIGYSCSTPQNEKSNTDSKIKKIMDNTSNFVTVCKTGQFDALSLDK